MNLHSLLANRLKEGGWELVRRGRKHEIWKLPDNQLYTLSIRIQDAGRRRINSLKAIERCEQRYKEKLKAQQDYKRCA